MNSSKNSMSVATNLIMDVGLHIGSDSEFYLRKGFKVVAIEANPELVERSKQRLAPYVETGQLKILNVGLHRDAGTFKFYVNLDKDDWSSFVREIGTRDGTRFKEIDVPCATFESIVAEYGMPYYLKVDIEGHDQYVLDAMHRINGRPKYISVEAGGIGYLAHLWVLGYRHFKIVNQANLVNVRCPHPAREGIYVDAQFDGHTSGPFGEESPGEWVSYEKAVYQYLTDVYTPEGEDRSNGRWFDFHAKL